MRITLLCLVLVAACSSSGRSALDAGPDDGPGPGDDAATGPVCGGFAHILCADNELCDFPDNGCGVGDQTGHCKARPVACPAVVGPPTCACDNKVYAGDCPAYVAGVDLNAHGTCDAAPGRFVCGFTQCELATQYCRREPHPGAADGFSCVPLPPCSTAPSCACLTNERCGKSCDGDARVGLTLSCPPTA